MPRSLSGRSFLKLLDFTTDEIKYLLELAKDFKRMKRAGTPHKYLAGKNIVLLFEKTSTRTRCSFEVAGNDLGMGVTYLDPGSSQMGKKESLEDTAKVLGRMFDGIEYRGFDQQIVEDLAKHAGVPVWNGPSHPDAGRCPHHRGALRLLQGPDYGLHGRCPQQCCQLADGRFGQVGYQLRRLRPQGQYARRQTRQDLQGDC